MKRAILLLLILLLCAPVVSAEFMVNYTLSSVYAGTDQGATYAAIKAVDNNGATSWISSGTSDYWGGDLGINRYIEGYNITMESAYAAYGPGTISLYGSTDNTNWYLMDYRTGVTYTANVNVTFYTQYNVSSYRYLKFLVVKSPALAITQLFVYNKGGPATSDTTPPSSITNLSNTTTCENVTFTWNNPLDSDYSHLYNLWDNVAQTNITNSTTTKAFTPAAGTHTFSTKTVDLSGNMNATWVNMSVSITACPTPTPTPTPSVTATVAPPSAGEQWCGRQTLFFEHNYTTTPAGYEGLINYPIGNPEVDENVTVINSAGWVLIDSYITPENLPNINIMNAGLRRFRAYSYVSSAVGTTQLNFTEFIRLSNGNEIKLFSAESSDINDLSTTEQLIGYALTTNVTMNATDRIVVKVYAKTTHSSNIQVHWVYQGATHPSHLETGFFVCPASACCVPTAAPGASLPYVVNPTTDKKTDWLKLVWDWWWLPALILFMIWLFGGRR